MKKTTFTKADLYQLLTGVFVGALIISNVLASRTFELLGITLPSAVIIFPVVYIINDVMAEVFGYNKTKRVIFLGFAVNILAVICYSIAIKLPAPIFATDIAEAFAVTLGSTWRVLLASFSAYIVGSLVNAKVMERMKQGKSLMARCVLSTLIGEGLDALIFITIAFAGTMDLTTLSIMIVSQAMFKTVFEIVVYPLTKLTVNKVKQLEA